MDSGPYQKQKLNALLEIASKTFENQFENVRDDKSSRIISMGSLNQGKDEFHLQEQSKDAMQLPPKNHLFSALLEIASESFENIHKEEEEEQKLKECEKILEELNSEELAWPFYFLRDPELFGFNNLEVEKPMDLCLVVEKMRNREYKSVTEFKKDVRLIFSNCEKYFSSEKNLVEMGRELQDIFEIRIARVVDERKDQNDDCSGISQQQDSDDLITKEICEIARVIAIKMEQDKSLRNFSMASLNQEEPSGGAMELLTESSTRFQMKAQKCPSKDQLFYALLKVASEELPKIENGTVELKDKKKDNGKRKRDTKVNISDNHCAKCKKHKMGKMVEMAAEDVQKLCMEFSKLAASDELQE